MKLFINIVLLIFLNACALGPIINQDVGRSLGKSNSRIRVSGYPQAESPNLTSIQMDTGLSDNWDIGFQYEITSMGLRLFYSIINNKEGFALSSSLGYGWVFSGNYSNLGLNMSYKAGAMEYFTGYRHTQVSLDATELTSSNTGDVFLNIPSADYDYGVASLGFKYWFTDRFNLALEAADFTSLSIGEFNSKTLVNIGLGYDF